MMSITVACPYVEAASRAADTHANNSINAMRMRRGEQAPCAAMPILLCFCLLLTVCSCRFCFNISLLACARCANVL